MTKVDEFNAADALMGMAGPNKEEEELEGFYDKRRNIKFPVKLMQVLDNEAYHQIISWTPDGLAFAILKPVVLEKQVLPAAFDTGTSKFKSFLRKLYRWGFLKKFHQSDDYTYYHKAFQRGKLSLCLTITRLPNVKKQSTTKNLSNSITNHAHLQQLAASGFPGANPLALPSHHGAADLNAAAANTDAAILNALKQKAIINEIMKVSAINRLTSAAAGLPHPSELEALQATATATGVMPPSLLRPPSLPGLSALQLNALVGRNNHRAGLSIDTLNALSLENQMLQKRNAAVTSAVLQQTMGLNDLLLGSTLPSTVPGSLLATSAGLRGGGFTDPTALLAAQSRLNAARRGGSPTLPVQETSGPSGSNVEDARNTAATTVSTTLLDQFSNAELLNNIGNAEALNDAAQKNLFLSSLAR